MTMTRHLLLLLSLALAATVTATDTMADPQAVPVPTTILRPKHTAVPIETLADPEAVEVPTTMRRPGNTAVPTTVRRPKHTAVPTTIRRPKQSAVPTTIRRPKYTAVPTSILRPDSTAVPTTSGLPGSSGVPTTSGLPGTTAVPTTSGLPDTTAVPTTSILPGTTAVPTNSSLPDTTAVPTTSGLPGTTAVPTTSGLPGTTAVPTTSGLPGTTAVPTTSSPPGTTAVPTNSSLPGSTAVPTTSGLPGTTAVPTTSGLPQYTAVPTNINEHTNTTTPKSVPVAGTNCTSDHEITPMCWEELRIPDYINAWMEANGTAANCDTLGFAQCFLGANGFTGLTCDDITSNTCPPFDTIRPGQYSCPQEFYVLWNIYNVYQLFNSWSLSLYNGAQLAAGTLDDIVAALSPATNKEVTPGIIYSLIAGSFYFLGNFMAIGAVIAPLLVVERFVAGLLVSNVAVAFSMTGTLVNFLAHGGDTDFRFTTLGTIGTDLSNLVVNFQQQLAHDIKMIQGNHTQFLAMTNEGALSLRLKGGLVDQSVNLFRDLQVYVISEALAANGIIVTKSTGVNALTFAPETQGNVDCPSLGPAGNCFQYWVDVESNNTYSFHNPGDWKRQYVDAINKIHDEGWANISELMVIEECQGKTVEFNPSTFNMTCLATHKQCEWNYPPDERDPYKSYSHELSKNQYTNCDNDQHWGYTCNSWTAGYQVPSAYIGPALTYPETGYVWCPFLKE